MAYTEEMIIENMIGNNSYETLRTEDKIRVLKHILHSDGEKLKKYGWKTFSDIHKVIERIMGRPTWTHEMAFPDMLYKELANGKKFSAFNDSMSEIGKTKPIIAVITDNKKKKKSRKR